MKSDCFMCRLKVSPKMQALLYGIASLVMLAMLTLMILGSIESTRLHNEMMKSSEPIIREIEQRRLQEMRVTLQALLR